MRVATPDCVEEGGELGSERGAHRAEKEKVICQVQYGRLAWKATKSIFTKAHKIGVIRKGCTYVIADFRTRISLTDTV